ncbi:hypothetical protein GH714_040500 [Hevea brasiliensis]|uniref:Uncharacterized protein n=1 Tax=Hevea brasiliensis TaxID=3981 RepID=A0A6A6L7U9_HEVBR|nr:hypothetical protein GH714_040500 [Hevea brasiliensis]
MFTGATATSVQYGATTATTATSNICSAGAVGVVRPSGAGVGVTDTGYATVAYDSAHGRQVYYTAQGGVMQAPPPYQGVGWVAVTGEMRHVGGGGGALTQDVLEIT